MADSPDSLDSSLHSPFARNAARHVPNRDGQIQVLLHAHTLPSVTLISTWPTHTVDLCAALAQALSATDPQALPAATGQTARCPLGLLLRTSPHEFMLIGDTAADLVTRVRSAIGPSLGAVLDLSHARCRVYMQGAKAVEALAKLFALDFREVAFPVGTLQLSGHHHVPCSLHRLGPARFDLYLHSSYAHGQLESLLDAALEYGVALTLHPQHPAACKL